MPEDNSSHTTSAQSTKFLLSNELFYNTPSEQCISHGIPVDEPAKASRTYPDVSEWSWILREETHVWSSRWTVIEEVSNVCSLLFSWNCEKQRNGKCKCGKEMIRCWPTVLWRCEGVLISNACSWLIPARQWRLKYYVNNNCITLYVLAITNCVCIIMCCCLLLTEGVPHKFLMKMRHYDGNSRCNFVKTLDIVTK